MTPIKFGTPSNISPKPVKLETSNLGHWCMWTISPKWTNKKSEKGRGLGHVTPIKFGIPSNISPKRVKLETSNLGFWCTWTISPKWTNNNSEKGRGLGHVTPIKIWHTLKHISKMSKARDFKFGTLVRVDSFSKMDK